MSAAPERVGITQAESITGLSGRKLRELAMQKRIPGVEKVDGAWCFDEPLLRGWVAGTVEDVVDEATARALRGRFPCPVYLGTQRFRPWPGRPDNVYFIQGSGAVLTCPIIKIGIALNPIGRLRELQPGCPFKLDLLATMPGGRQTEMFLHRFYDAERVQGEWFKASERLLEYVERVKK